MKILWKCCVSLRLNSLTLGTLDLVARAILQLSLGHWGTVCMAVFRSRGLPNFSILYFDLPWEHVTACARRDSCMSHPSTSIGNDSSALSWQVCGKFVFQGEDEANHRPYWHEDGHLKPAGERSRSRTPLGITKML